MFPLWRPGFSPVTVHVEFGVKREALGQFFFNMSALPCQLFMLYSHLSTGACAIGPFVAPVQGTLSHTFVTTLNCHSFIISIVLSTNTGSQIIIH
jgi:hypothetical protein